MVFKLEWKIEVIQRMIMESDFFSSSIFADRGHFPCQSSCINFIPPPVVFSSFLAGHNTIKDLGLWEIVHVVLVLLFLFNIGKFGYLLYFYYVNWESSI